MQKEVESNVVVDSEAKPVESQEATGEEHHPVVVDSGDLEQTLEPASAPEESKKVEVQPVNEPASEAKAKIQEEAVVQQEDEEIRQIQNAENLLCKDSIMN